MVGLLGELQRGLGGDEAIELGSCFPAARLGRAAQGSKQCRGFSQRASTRFGSVRKSGQLPGLGDRFLGQLCLLAAESHVVFTMRLERRCDSGCVRGEGADLGGKHAKLYARSGPFGELALMLHEGAVECRQYLLVFLFPRCQVLAVADQGLERSLHSPPPAKEARVPWLAAMLPEFVQRLAEDLEGRRIRSHVRGTPAPTG